MALNARQQRLYRDTCDLWQKSQTKNTDGKGTPGADTFTKIASAVPYYHEETVNIDTRTEVGGLVEPSLLTTDKAHFDIAQNIPDGVYFHCTTPGVPRNGRVYSALGPTQFVPSFGNRRANKQTVLLRWLEHPPSQIV